MSLAFGNSSEKLWFSTFHRGVLQDFCLLEKKELKIEIKGVEILRIRLNKATESQPFCLILKKDPDATVVENTDSEIRIHYKNTWWGEWEWVLRRDSEKLLERKNDLLRELNLSRISNESLPDGISLKKALFQSSSAVFLSLSIWGLIQNGVSSEDAGTGESAEITQSIQPIPEKYRKILSASLRESQQSQAAKNASAKNTKPQISARAVQTLKNQVRSGNLLRQVQRSALLARTQGTSLQFQLGSQSVAREASRNPAGTTFAGSTQDALSGGQGTLTGSANGLEKAGLSKLGSQKVALQLLPPRVEEGLSKEEVGEVIHRHSAEIRYCYEASLIHTPELSGKLVLQFTIGKSGSVVRAGVQGGSIQDSRLESCIVSKLQSWGFPRPHGGVEVPVTYPFLFRNLGTPSGKSPIKTAFSQERGE